MTQAMKKIGLLTLIAVMCASSAAVAEKGGRGKSKHDKHKWEDSDRHHDRRGHDDDDVRIIIGGGDRVIIREYISERYHCPPGLAKKHNGCLPPGHAKHYVIGRPLPDYVTWYPLPRDVLVRLEPVPVGYQYVRVDRDVLLVSEASKKVIDAITLLSAVNY